MAGVAGLFAGYAPRTDRRTGYQDLWLHNVQGGAILGRHRTSHLKLELEATATSEKAFGRARHHIALQIGVGADR